MRRRAETEAGAAALVVVMVIAAVVATGCRRAPVAAVAPEEPPTTIRDTGSAGARAFLRMTELAGNWLAGEEPVTFEVIQRGHVVAQRGGGGYVVWHADGNLLAATVFADEGYVARMSSKAITESPTGELIVELETKHVANVVPDEPMVTEMKLTIAPQNDGVTQRWVIGGGDEVARGEGEGEEEGGGGTRERVMTRTETGALPPSTRTPPSPSNAEPTTTTTPTTPTTPAAP